MATNTLVPSTRSGNFITGTKLALAGTEAAIKTFKGVLQTTTKVADATGDGDSAPAIVDNGYVYHRFRLIGAVVSGSTLTGINKLGVAATPIITSMVLNLASGRTITLTNAVLDAIVLDLQVTGPWHGIAISGHASETAKAVEAQA